MLLAVGADHALEEHDRAGTPVDGDQVGGAVAVHVRGIDAHSGFVAAVLAGRDTGHERNILKGSIVFIEEEKIRPGVVGDGDVGPAIVVEIGEHHAHAFRFRFSHSRRIAHIGKRSVVIVVIQLGFLPFVIARIAVRAVTRPAFAAPQIVLRSPVDIVGDQKIEPAVFVVVKPSRAGRPFAFICDARFCGDVGERSIAIIVIENGAAIAGHVKIRVAVVVVVSDGDALPVVSRAADAGLFGDVGKGSVAVVVIQRRAQRMRWLINIRGRRLNEIQIQQAVLVVVDPAHARAHCLQVILFVRLRGVLHESDSRSLADVGETNRNMRLAGFRGLAGHGLIVERDQTEQADREEGNARGVELPPTAS